LSEISANLGQRNITSQQQLKSSWTSLDKQQISKPSAGFPLSIFRHCLTVLARQPEN